MRDRREENKHKVSGSLIGQKMAFIFLIYDQNERRKIQRRFIRNSANPFDLPDAEFQKNYRMNKDMALYLCRELEVGLAAERSHGLPIHVKILTAVSYIASGAYQRKVGQDHNLAIAQTTVSKYLGTVVEAINSQLRHKFIQFPNTQEARLRVARAWEEKSGLPHILGAIDCTHISIFPPPRPEGLQYINRKGYHSINVQLIADADCRILNVNAQYPGRVHDQFIFQNSVVRTEMARLHQNRIGEFYLLGDSGYALAPWVMTPILHAEEGSPQERYTKWHCQNRNVIERTNGYLKGSMRCLGIDQNLHYAPAKASSIIYAACTLYNMMKHFRVPMELTEGEQQEEPQNEEDNIHSLQEEPLQLQQFAILKRETIINTYFN